MSRIRTIKPEFPQSESIGRLSRDARLLFIQLWTLCDDRGRTRASSRALASLLYPYDDDAPGLMSDWLEELSEHGHINVYEVDGSRYLEIIKWHKHQKVDHPSTRSLFPGPNGLDSPRDSLATDNDRLAKHPDSIATVSRVSPKSSDGTKDQGKDQGAKKERTMLRRPQQSERKQSAYSESFEQFWQAYPADKRGMSKPNAFKRWKPLSEADQAAALDALPGYAATLKPDKPGGFAPQPKHVEGWLSSRRWETLAGPAPEAPNPYTAMSRAPLPVPTDPRKALVHKLGMQGINRKTDQQGVPRNYPPETDDEWLTLLQGWQVGIIGPNGGVSWPRYAGGPGSEPDKSECKAPRRLFEQLGLEPPPLPPRSNGGTPPKQPPSPDQQRELADGVLAGALVLDGPPPGHPGSLIGPEVAREKGLIP